MKRTRIEALKMISKHWHWLAVNPDKDKWEWPGLERNVSACCYACQYSKENMFNFCCDKCIVPVFAKNGYCLWNEQSPYQIWHETSKPYSEESLRIRAKAALEIAESCDGEVGRLEAIKIRLFCQRS